jgi:peptide deformylase
MSDLEDDVCQILGITKERLKNFDAELVETVKEKIRKKLEANPNEMKLIKYPSNSLVLKSNLVTDFNKEIEVFTRQLKIFARRLSQVSLSAPQVNFNFQVAVILVDALDMKLKSNYEQLGYPDVLINPSYVPLDSLKVKTIETCSSLPGVKGYVERHKNIKVTYSDLKGTLKELEVTGIDNLNSYGIIVQHEIDHLNGTLIVDKFSSIDQGRNFSSLKNLKEQEGSIATK